MVIRPTSSFTGISGAATLLYYGCVHVVHAHLVFIVLDHQGEETNLDRTTDLKEPGTGGCLPLQNKGQKGEIYCSPGSIANQQTWQVKWEKRLGT